MTNVKHFPAVVAVEAKPERWVDQDTTNEVSRDDDYYQIDGCYLIEGSHKVEALIHLLAASLHKTAFLYPYSELPKCATVAGSPCAIRAPAPKFSPGNPALGYSEPVNAAGLEARPTHVRVTDDVRDHNWRIAVESALGVETNAIDHTPAWARRVISEIREIGNRAPAASPAFKVGQRVRVVACRRAYATNAAQQIGKIGTVTTVRGDDSLSVCAAYSVEIGSGQFGYDADELEPAPAATDEAGDDSLGDYYVDGSLVKRHGSNAAIADCYYRREAGLVVVELNHLLARARGVR